MDLKEWLKEDWIKNIYYGDTLLAEKMPETAEYKEIVKKQNILLNRLVETNQNIKEQLYEYNEYSLVKEGIEAEFEFKLGFKTAICLIIQGLGKET